MSRRVRYHVACSLDGFIAGPNGEYDWIGNDPDIDFGALFDEFDTLIMGRTTYELIAGDDTFKKFEIVVVSTTLRPEDHPGVRIIADGLRETVDELRARPGKDIWLFGGGKLFRSLSELDCVDTVEPALIPILLGEGIPMFPRPYPRSSLRLRSQRVYEKSGIIMLRYDVVR